MKILCVKGSIHMINVIFTIYEINLVFSNMNISCSMKQRSCTLILVTLVKHCSFVWHKNRSSNQPKDIGLSCTTVFLYTTTFTSLLYHLYNTYSIEWQIQVKASMRTHLIEGKSNIKQFRASVPSLNHLLLQHYSKSHKYKPLFWKHTSVNSSGATCPSHCVLDLSSKPSILLESTSVEISRNLLPECETPLCPPYCVAFQQPPSVHSTDIIQLVLILPSNFIL